MKKSWQPVKGEIILVSDGVGEFVERKFYRYEPLYESKYGAYKTTSDEIHFWKFAKKRELPVPKYRIGQKVKCNGGYSTIYYIEYEPERRRFLYNFVPEDKIQILTEEELSLYFN